MLRICLAIHALFFAQLLSAQICGTPSGPIMERLIENKRTLQITQRGAEKYIPITFHLVANAAGNGRVTEESILTQVATLNEQYDDQDITFYIDRFNYFNNDAVYNEPAGNAATIQMRARRDNNSINVFITNNADSGNEGPGTVLAYYDPGEDWVVNRKDRIGTGSTLGHELGHFFSLAHPHEGWNCKPYTIADYGNPVTVDFTLPCDSGLGSREIELQDGSNCETTADRLCDTPPDYNMGFTFQSGCAPNNTVRDKNNQLITPLAHNIMSYYSGCDSATFTQGQINLVNTDYFKPQRAYIRTGLVPVLDPVPGPVSYISPINGEETPTSTDIRLDWEDSEGATHYLVVLARNASFTIDPERFVVEESELTIDALVLGRTYHWKVWPYNQTITDAGFSATQNFVVGEGVGVNDINEINEYVISPNPISNDEYSVLTLTTIDAFDASLKITDAAGHVLVQQSLVVPSGTSTHSLETDNLPSGIYFVMLHANSGTLVERLMIIE